MAWPRLFRRRDRTRSESALPDTVSDQGGVLPGEVQRAPERPANPPAWAGMAPLRTTASRPIEPVARSRGFVRGLDGHQPVYRALEPLAHDVRVDAPRGLVSGILTPRPAPAPANELPLVVPPTPEPEVAPPPPGHQRVAAPTVQRSPGPRLHAPPARPTSAEALAPRQAPPLPGVPVRRRVATTTDAATTPGTPPRTPPRSAPAAPSTPVADAGTPPVQRAPLAGPAPGAGQDKPPDAPAASPPTTASARPDMPLAPGATPEPPAESVDPPATQATFPPRPADRAEPAPAPKSRRRPVLGPPLVGGSSDAPPPPPSRPVPQRAPDPPGRPRPGPVPRATDTPTPPAGGPTPSPPGTDRPGDATSAPEQTVPTVGQRSPATGPDTPSPRPPDPEPAPTSPAMPLAPAPPATGTQPAEAAGALQRAPDGTSASPGRALDTSGPGPVPTAADDVPLRPVPARSTARQAPARRVPLVARRAPVPVTRGPVGSRPEGPSRPPAQRAAAPGPSAGPAVPVQRAPLTPPAEVRSMIEARTGTDLSDVSVHRGPDTTDAASDLQARAFTSGAEVHLPDDHGPLSVGAGRSLLAHELTHVAQQRALGPALPPESSPLGQRLEAEAVAAERSAATGTTVRPPGVTGVTGPAPSLPLAQRAPDPSARQAQDPTAVPAEAAAVAVGTGLATPGPDGAVHFAPPGGWAAGGIRHASTPSGPAQRAAAGGDEVSTSITSGPASGREADDDDIDDSQELDELARQLWPRLSERLRGDLLTQREHGGGLVGRL